MCKQTKTFCIKIFDSQQSTRRKSKFTIMRTIQLFAVIFCIASSFGAEILGLNEVIKTKENTKIVGGETIEMEEAPFVALLMFKRRPHCGASILSTTCLLTASVSFSSIKLNQLFLKLAHSQHCVENPEKTALYKVKTGTSSVYEGETHQVKEIIKHPEYKAHNYDFDFAIVKIIYPMAFNERQRPIALVDSESDNPKPSEGVRVFGWGDTHSLLESSDYLRAVDLIIVDHELCERQYKSFQMKIRTNKICAAHPNGIDGKDACQVRFCVLRLKVFHDSSDA